LSFENEFNYPGSRFEMQEDIKVEVECLGAVLEGEGKIGSTLEIHDYPAFGEALTQSIARIEELDCAACIDGRCVECTKNGGTAKIRSRKAGGSVSTFVMMGMGNRNFLGRLDDTAHSAEDLFSRSAELQEFLGNKQSGHDDCAAAKGAVDHVRGVAQLKDDHPNLQFAKSVVASEYPEQDIELLSENVRNQASGFAYVLDSRRWNGDKYVEKISEEDPDAVEVLRMEDNDVHGHAEDAIVIVDGPVDENLRPLHTIDKDKLKELTGREAFIVNLNELRRDALMLGGTQKQRAQLFLSTLLHHAGGAYKNLGNGTHPIYLVQVHV
jgi:hypothetical protein